MRACPVSHSRRCAPFLFTTLPCFAPQLFAFIARTDASSRGRLSPLHDKIRKPPVAAHALDGRHVASRRDRHITAVTLDIRTTPTTHANPSPAPPIKALLAATKTLEPWGFLPCSAATTRGKIEEEEGAAAASAAEDLRRASARTLTTT